MTAEDVYAATQRNVDSSKEIEKTTLEILSSVKKSGDRTLLELGEQLDHVKISKLFLDADEIADIAMRIGREELRALEIAFSNIYSFHAVQTKKERKVETMPGVMCWREMRPIEKVGLYIPGGTAVLPSTLLMLGVPARIAGCKEIVVCTPPQADGKINPYIAYCLHLLKIERIYLVGGAQAIAAMAYGTNTVPKVDKIFGPGNQYVTTAKTLVQRHSEVAIDMPAGPSEVLIIADDTADSRYIAADLLAQAEHGSDSQAILVSTSKQIIEKVNKELLVQIAALPRRAVAQQALENSFALWAPDLAKCFEFSNRYAPEHLLVQIDSWKDWIRQIQNAGSVFFGHMSPESIGDYASGTNHTLPTSGYAKSHSGVSVDSFVKKITFQHINEEGFANIGPTVEILAQMEGLEGHKNAVTIRKK